jgi:L-rhamnose mutarotase
VERMCFVMPLNPGQEEKYDRVHQEMSDEVRAALVEAGYSNYTIFRLGSTVIGYAECEPDVQTVLDNQRSHPAMQGWGPALAGVAQGPLEVAAEVWRL